MSGIVDFDDWGIVKIVFDDLLWEWGLYDIDLFVCDYNVKVDKFCFRYWNFFMYVVDVFIINWIGLNVWIVLLFYFILRVLENLNECKGYGILVVLLWELLVFWLILIFEVYRLYIVDWKDFLVVKEFYICGKFGFGIFGKEDLKFRMFVFVFDFRV